MKPEHTEHQNRRRVQAYLADEEAKRDFEADAEDHGGISKFVRYLYRQYKRAQQQSADDEGKRAA